MTAIARPAALMWAALAAFAFSLCPPAVGQAFLIPGDPRAGMQTFFDKGCGRCHAVLGEGGRSAPDLARAPAGHLSAAELAAAMWNHAPAMWEKMRLERVATPRFSTAEVDNLLAFLYSVRSLDEPGDADHGRKLLAEKRCLDCHAIAGQGGRGGPDLKSWAAFRNPVSWIQAMWNHGLAMQSKMAQRDLTWPQFRGNDMADLVAAIRTLAANPKPRAPLRQASAENGSRVFRAKGCSLCHFLRGGGRGPDLGASALPRTLGQFAGQMWNHAPSMWKMMQARSLARPEFSNQEMADLLAYLFSERYFDAAGSAERGRRSFQEKGCASCHTPGGGGPGFDPGLLSWRNQASPAPLAAALWNHGPVMLQQMRKRRITWPRFGPGEMTDVLAFLNGGPGGTRVAGLRASKGAR